MRNEAGATGPRHVRFLSLDQVAKQLSTSKAQVYALVRSGALPAIKIGGRGQKRIETSQHEAWIEDRYQQTADYVAANAFASNASTDGQVNG